MYTLFANLKKKEKKTLRPRESLTVLFSAFDRAVETSHDFRSRIASLRLDPL